MINKPYLRSMVLFFAFFGLCSSLYATHPAVRVLSLALETTYKNKKKQAKQSELRKRRRGPLSYVEAGSNQWNRRVLCVIKGDKLYMFRHADYLSDQGNVFQVINHPMEHYPDYHVFGVKNRSYVSFAKSVVVDTGKRLRGVSLWSAGKVPDVAVVDMKKRKVILRNKREVDLSTFRLPKEIIISRKKEGRYDDGFGGATRHLYPETYESIKLGDEVEWIFWRYHASMVPALKGKVVIQSYVRPFEFTIVNE